MPARTTPSGTSRGANGPSEWLTPLATTDYTLTCTSIGGVVSRTVKIEVDPDRAVHRLESWGEDIEEFRDDLVVVASFDDGLHVLDLGNPVAPALVVSAVHWAVKKSPADRFKSAEGFRSALKL